MKKKKVILPIVIISIIIIILAAVVIYRILGIKADPETGTREVTQSTENSDNTETVPQTREAGEQDISKWDLNKVNVVEDTEGIIVPVPKGYVASSIDGEHTVKTGFVIYEGETAVTDENKEEAQKTRNQWVWVPVENINDIYATDSKGKKYGQLWDFSDEGRTRVTYSVSGFREPDVATAYDKSTYLPNLEAEYKQSELKEELQQEFEYAIKLIDKYGGFYIGRYETGDLSKPNVKVVKGNTDIVGQTWYTMYKKCQQILPNENKNVRTSMIWGSLWDHTLYWLVASENKTFSDMVDSTGWGNYNNNTFQYQDESGNMVEKAYNRRIKIPSGSTEYTKANNIYDMAGNVWDWTLETRNVFFRVKHGGYYENSGSETSVSYRDASYPYSSTGAYGTRAVLYAE